jgi:hypothetical protein
MLNNISNIIQEDLFLIESTGVTRETGDLLRLLLPVFKKIVAEEGAATPPPGWQITRESDIGTHEFSYQYQVPGYWKIPVLSRKTLEIEIFFYPMPNMPHVRMMGAASLEKLILTVRAIIPDWNINLLGDIQRNLKELLVHELTHFKDERPVNVAYPSIRKRSEGDFTYLSHPQEVKAFVSSMVNVARTQKMTFAEVVKAYAEEIWSETCTPEEVQRLIQLYMEEYNSRGYGARQRRR